MYSSPARLVPFSVLYNPALMWDVTGSQAHLPPAQRQNEVLQKVLDLLTKFPQNSNPMV